MADQSTPLCIYHGGCDDGFAAAFIVDHFFGGRVELYPGVYQDAPPDVTGRDVILVDFSYKRPMLEEMAKDARSILILDHHKTAQADLANLGTYAIWNDHIRAGGIHVMFDMYRSGATLAWDYFFPNHTRPDFVNYIEDRDLWRKQMADGDEFIIALRSYPQEIDVWKRLFTTDAGLAVLIGQGKHIQRYYRQQVEAMKANAYPATITYGVMSSDPSEPLGDAFETVEIMVANAPYAFASEVAGELAEKTGIGASFFQLADGRWQYSLRSRNGIDVTPIALAFGGGGHAAAAGFTVPQPVHVHMDLAAKDEAKEENGNADGALSA